MRLSSKSHLQLYVFCFLCGWNVLPVRADLADRIAACPEDGCLIELRTGERYVETKPWNLRGKKNLSIVGHGEVVHFCFPNDAKTPLAIDATGATWLLFNGWTMATANTCGKPDVGLLLGRATDGKSTGNHRFDRWQIEGYYAKAAVVSLASEMNVWTQCELRNFAPNSIVFWTGRNNELKVTSPFGEFGVGGTNSCHDFIATGFVSYGGEKPGDLGCTAVWIASGTHDLHIRGGTMAFPKGGPNSAALRLGTPEGQGAINILLDGVEWESFGARHAIVIPGRVDGLTVRNSFLQSKDEAIVVEKMGFLFDSAFEWNRILVRMSNAPITPPANLSVAVVRGMAVGNRFDFHAQTTLVPLARSEYVAARYALTIDPDAVFRGNEVRVQNREDISAPKGVLDDNEVRP